MPVRTQCDCARAVVRNAGGHAYWSELARVASLSLKALPEIYMPLSMTSSQPPDRTEKLPIAGPGMDHKTLPLIFDCVILQTISRR